MQYKNDVLNSDIQEYTLPIHILPPWYLTTVALCTYLLLLFGLIYYFIRKIRKRLLRRQAIITRQIKEEQKEKLYKAKLNFFANITHEFCTPLTLINGVNSYISETAQQSRNPKLGKYAQILQENVKSLNELIHEILDFQQIEEKDFTQPNIQQVPVSDLINKQCESFRPIAEQNGIDFIVSTSEAPTYWNTDYSSLKKIMRNLISNAFKYTDEKGKIEITVRTENGALQIAVYNSGKGIDEINLHKIFDRHQILGDIDCNNYTANTSQHGLGLYICYNLVRLLQGEITVESQKNVFTTFKVTLPPLELSPQSSALPKSESQESVAPSATQDDNQQATDNRPLVLIIDDNRDIVWLIKDTLSDSYLIQEAYSAEEGLLFMEQQKPNLIITDIMMPNMDGLELINRIKSDKFTKHIPIIVVSAKISEQDQAKGLDLGADLYLPKPFSPLVLLSSVNRLIANKQEMKQYYHSPESAYEQYGEQVIHQADKEFIDEITTILQENISQENIRPEFIAEKLGINSRTLYRRFKKISPLTPSDFIKDYRLTYAAQLLITTNLSVQEIIYRVGISNKSYFYREFSEKYNMTPRQYRQQKE